MLPATLNEEARAYARASRSPNTLRAYKADCRIFADWCAARGATPLPATPDVLRGFIADEANCGVAARTIERRLAAIQHLHKAKSYPSPVDESVREVLAGIKRTLGIAPRPRAPLVADAIKQIIDVLDADLNNSPHGSNKYLAATRDRALILLGFSAALRRSELATLQVADVSETDAGMLLTIRRSKGDQVGAGQQVAIAPALQAKYDTALALRAWLVTSGKTSGLIFPLSPYGICTIIQRRAKAAGFTADVAAHSLRSGAITTAAQNGASLYKMLELSRHKNIETLKGYMHKTDLFKDQALKGAL